MPQLRLCLSFFLIFAALALVVEKDYPEKGRAVAMKIRIGEEAPDFTLIDEITGKEVRLSDYKGKKVVMLDFWALWCDACLVEIPRLVKHYQHYRDQGFELLGIAINSGNSRPIQEAIRKYEIPYPILIDRNFTVITKKYGLVGMIPLKAIIDLDGVLRYAYVGEYPPGKDEIPSVIEKLLKEKK